MEEQEVKWEEGQNVRAVVHVQGGTSGGWIGRLKSAMARRKAEKASLEPVPFTNFGQPEDRTEPKKSRGIAPLSMSQEEVETSAWSASPTTQPPKPWNPFTFAPKPKAPSPPPAAPARTSSVEDARPVMYEQRGALPLHMHFSKRSPSPDAPNTPPGLPVSSDDSRLPRQVPPVSTVPGGRRVPYRHRAQNSSVSLNGNPFVTPFDDERSEGRYPVMGRAI
ncbi:hypothetical protein FS749_007419 [Ceratobasidium sp. UAMH 11750]|nr:hypothetical protein FS749_007419 [Ceratobasidium sp. UAMH 11750]